MIENTLENFLLVWWVTFCVEVLVYTLLRVSDTIPQKYRVKLLDDFVLP